MSYLNNVYLSGEIASPFSFHHRIINKKTKEKKNFYVADIKVKRLSGDVDTIPLLFQSSAIDPEKDMTGTCMQVYGSYRSYNKKMGRKNHLELHVFVTDFRITEQVDSPVVNNKIELSGAVKKEPYYRKTPKMREITELLVTSKRDHGKKDYIPCITWNQNAREAKNLHMGDCVTVEGRIQSREYGKKNIAYEVSVSKMKLASITHPLKRMGL